MNCNRDGIVGKAELINSLENPFDTESVRGIFACDDWFPDCLFLGLIIKVRLAYNTIRNNRRKQNICELHN